MSIVKLANPFIKEQLPLNPSCLLPWVFSTRAVNYKISKLHEKGLRASLNDETST